VVAGAAVERLAVGLDRLAQLAHLAVGVAEGRVQVGELAARGGVEPVRRHRRQQPGPELPRALVLAALLVHRDQGEGRLGVGGVDLQGALQVGGGAFEIPIALPQDADHVVEVGVARVAARELLEGPERARRLPLREALAQGQVGLAILARHPLAMHEAAPRALSARRAGAPG
jgi:hypothetical protein